MKHVIGYVCVAKFQLSWIAFGPRVSVGVEREYENLLSNGIKAFPSLETALRAEGQIVNKPAPDFVSVSTARIEMFIAEDSKEFTQFREEKFLIVIGDPCGECTSFLGRKVDKCPNAYPVPGAYLWQNGGKTFINFRDAYACVSELHRQSQGPATIANLK